MEKVYWPIIADQQTRLKVIGETIKKKSTILSIDFKLLTSLLDKSSGKYRMLCQINVCVDVLWTVLFPEESRTDSNEVGMKGTVGEEAKRTNFHQLSLTSSSRTNCCACGLV